MALTVSRRTPVTPRWMLRLLWLTTRRHKFRPIWQSDLVANDLLGQAEFLFGAGYQIAAAMLTRSHVERSLKRLAMVSATWEECRAKSVPDFTEYLMLDSTIDRRLANLAGEIWTKASKICHTGEVSKLAVMQIMRDARAFQRRFDEAMKAALHRAEQ